MDKTRNNKKPTKELRGPDKNQTAGKAGYSRAEQDAQKDYEKAMKMHGSPSTGIEYTPPSFTHPKAGNDSERKSIQEKDTEGAADSRKQSYTSRTVAKKSYPLKESNITSPGNSSNVQQVSKQITQYETTDKGYAYHGNMQEAQKEYVLHLKSHGQGIDPAKEDTSERYVKYITSGEVPVAKDANHHTKQEDSIDSNVTKRSGSQRATSGVLSQYEKKDKGYVYHGNMQEAQKDYVVFMKSHGNLRMEAEDASLSSGTIVRKIELDGNIEPKRKSGREQPYIIKSPVKRMENAKGAYDMPSPEKVMIAPESDSIRLSDHDTSDIKRFDLKKMNTPGTGAHKIAKLERLAVKASTLYLVSTATFGSDVHRGTETARDIYGTTALVIADNARVTMAKSIQKNVTRNLDLYNKLLKETGGEHMFLKYSIRGRIADQKDVQKLQKGINAILHKQYGVTIKGTGKVGWWNASRFLKIHGSKLSPDMKIIIKTVYKDAMNIQTFNGNGRVGRLRALTRVGSRRIARYIRQSEAGYGAYLTYNILTRGRSLLRGALFAVRSSARVGYKPLVMGAKGVAWAAGKTAKHIPKPVKDTVKNNKYVRKASNAKNKAVDVGKKARRKGQNAVDRYRKFRRDPFGIKARISGAGKRAANAALNRLNQTWLKKPVKVGGKVLKAGGKVLRVPNIISSAIGRVMAAIASVVSAVVSFALVGIIAVVVVLLLLSFLLNLFTSIISLFDFTAHEEEIVNAALEQIETCYEEQIDSINAMRGNYRNMTITYRDVRDDEAYEEHDVVVAETTNSAEILSMATVYFDFDLEDAGERKVKDYVKKLYNGSHQTSIATRTYNFTDEDGDPYTVTDADVTLTTYYFNGLFDCELTDSYGTLSGTTTTMQVWNYFRSAGFSEEATAGIMGNLYQESGVDPTCIQGNGAGPAAGIAQWENYNTQSGRWKEMADYCESQGKPWTDLKCQLDYILIEMPGVFRVYTGHGTYTYPNGTVTWWPESVSMEEYKQLDDIDTAVEIFERTFERASIPNMARRISQAHAYYDMYHGVEASSAEAQAVVDRAYSQMGKPYEWGAGGPDTYDCSGLVSYALTGSYGHRWSTTDYMTWTRVSNPQPGDICTSSTHCGIYIGNNQMIHAPHTGDVVKIGSVPSNMIFVRYESQ